LPQTVQAPYGPAKISASRRMGPW